MWSLVPIDTSNVELWSGATHSSPTTVPLPPAPAPCPITGHLTVGRDTFWVKPAPQPVDVSRFQLTFNLDHSGGLLVEFSGLPRNQPSHSRGGGKHVLLAKGEPPLPLQPGDILCLLYPRFPLEVRRVAPPPPPPTPPPGPRVPPLALLALPLSPRPRPWL